MSKESKSNEERLKLLFFDNQSFVVKSLVMNLKLRDWDVTLVSDIDELFHLLNRAQYHVLILDIMAPIPPLNCNNVSFTESEINEMNSGLNTGVVLAKRIWQHEKYKEVPILFLSGRADPIPTDPILQERKQNHKCDHLRKPQWAKDVDQLLKKMLNPQTPD